MFHVKHRYARRMRTLMSRGFAAKGAVVARPSTPVAAYAPAFCGFTPPAAMSVRCGSISRSSRTSGASSSTGTLST